jgi:DNA-binding NarL/FixJ family response regulator
MPITVLLADDAASVRTAIKHLLEIEPGLSVVGEAANFSETLAMCADLKPNIVLLDIHMPGDHLEPQYVRSNLLDCAKSVLAMSVWNDEECGALADLYGASQFLDKAALVSELIPAIMAAAG